MAHWRSRQMKPERAAWLFPVVIVLLVLLASLLGDCAARAQANDDPFAHPYTLAGGSTPAQGMPCADRAGLVEQLREQFGETVHGLGLTDAGGVMELYASEKGSWTLVINLPNGRSCLVATGRDWESIARPKGRDT